MSAGPQIATLGDGRRLHLHHGPIDLIIGAEGAGRAAAFEAASERFEAVLTGLVSELDVLRRPMETGAVVPDVVDPIAKRMIAAVQPHSSTFVTPMAAVAGAVADEMLSAMTQAGDLTRAFVNNGGDIAFQLCGEEVLNALGPAGEIALPANSPARGLATSGWAGRSHSLGIADAVTVVARNAAQADVAATLIANAVDLPGHPAIKRTPASELSPDSDLRDRLVTTEVGALTRGEADIALERGVAEAEAMLSEGLILQAVLSLNGEVRAVGSC